MPYQDGVAQDLWILSMDVDNNPWGRYQPLIPTAELLKILSDLTSHLSFRDWALDWTVFTED
jgi:hypothetical protein